MLLTANQRMEDCGVRVVVAPDSFGDTLSATEAAAAIADGWRSVSRDDELDRVPLSDGGPGWVEVLHQALGGRLVAGEVADPLERPVHAEFLLAGSTAYVESAQACGLHLLGSDERDPRRTTTRGVGQLVAAAVDSGARRVVVGLGGSGTNDGGAGLWDALGGRAPAVELVAATDVDNPLLGPNGASAVFGPQKGADRAMVLDLDDRLRHWADDVEALVGRPGLRNEPGAGAAGGLGFALLALGGRRESGFGIVAEAVDLRGRLARADLVLTGEGRFDAQSTRGKVPGAVAALALDAGVPCVVVAGQSEIGRRDAAAAGVSEVFTAADELGSAEAALAAGAAGVRKAAAAAARQWARRPAR